MKMTLKNCKDSVLWSNLLFLLSAHKMPKNGTKQARFKRFLVKQSTFYLILFFIFVNTNTKCQILKSFSMDVPGSTTNIKRPQEVSQS